MTKHKKIILTLALTLILSAVFVCGVCVGAGASGTSQKITATLEPGITVTIDGVPQQFFDANGKRVYPIAYEGSTYLPLRAVCQDVAGFKVGWDQATRTAAIATKPAAEGVDLIDTYNVYDRTSNSDQWAAQTKSTDKKTGEISGITVNNWIQFYWKSWASSGTNKSLRDTVAFASFNVQGKYDTVTFKYYSPWDATLQVIGDNDSVLFEIEVPAGQVAQEATVDLLKTNQLTFKYTNRSSHEMGAYIFDAYLK